MVGLGHLALEEVIPAFGESRFSRLAALVSGHSDKARKVAGQHLELDHMARCVLEDRPPYTGGEEGLQDLRIMAAIYESARSGSRVSLSIPGSTRGPQPALEA